MNTWTVLLVSHPFTKMTKTQRISFTSFRDGPPRLTSFNGSIAERHLENLKIMRAIGIKKYAEACVELTSEEIMLRQKIYNLYCGPGSALLRLM